MAEIDITPFGFTPTESRAYNALLTEGPSSGYALAKKLNVARANAYQALNGLVKKSAATTTDERPERYRAVRPDAILAHLTAAEAGKLDALEAQIRGAPSEEGETLVALFGRRALIDTALRTAAREPGPVTCVGPADMVGALSPAWHKRHADGLPSVLWIVGERVELPVEPAGVIDPDLVRRDFAASVLLLVASKVVVAARIGEDTASGYWASDMTIVGLVKTAVEALSAPLPR